jgi:hypothetical protein
MLRLFFGLLLIVLLVGCSSKDEEELFRSYADKITYHKLLQKTEKATLSDENNSKIVVTATYIYKPNVTTQDKRPEKFIVGVLNDSDTKHLYFHKAYAKENYLLTLNNQSAIRVEKLTLKDYRLKDISFVTDWGTYYEVTFPHVNTEQFDLILEHPNYGKQMLHFAKVAKFVYSKSGF